MNCQEITEKLQSSTMLYNLKNGRINIDDTTVDYVSFGKGKNVLIIIPGLGDGLRTVKGMALPLAYMYKTFAKDYRVYIFSRRNLLRKGFTTADMADDIVKCMKKINIRSADFIGISQGGMIAQCVAIRHKEVVKKLVLAVTLSKPNRMINENIKFWVNKAKKRDYKSIYIDTAEKTYTEKKLKKYRKLYGILSIITKPKDYRRFIIQALSCLNHNMYDKLDMIESPALVIGASEDKIVGVNASKEIAGKIKDCEIYIFDGYGHGVYQETGDFNAKVLQFLNKYICG